MSTIDSLHEPSAAFFDLPRPGGAINDSPQVAWPWPKSEPPIEGVYNINPTMTPLLRLLAERAQAPCTDWLGMQPKAKKPEQGFDSEAHAKFMRSLG